MTAEPAWLGGGDPHDPERSSLQAAWLKNWGRDRSGKVLDLGCGEGRTVLLLAGEGHDVLGIDRDPVALGTCRDRLKEAGVGAKIEQLDFLETWPGGDGGFDLICCLGNTFMLVHEIDAAINLLQRCCSSLGEGGLLVIDDLPAEFIPEVEAGHWQTGLSPDGNMQMIWSDEDEVFTIRTGDAVDPDNWSLEPGDVRLRLWTDRSLMQVAEAAGLSAPTREDAGAVLVMRPGGPSSRA